MKHFIFILLVFAMLPSCNDNQASINSYMGDTLVIPKLQIIKHVGLENDNVYAVTYDTINDITYVYKVYAPNLYTTPIIKR